MSILISGTSGYLGSVLYQEIEKRLPNQVFKLERNSLAQPTPKSISISSISNDPGILQQFDITTIFHCAALSSVSECENNPQIAQLSNVELTRQLANAAAHSSIQLIFLSTDLVFDGVQGVHSALFEDSQPCATSVYGKTKLEAESIVLNSNDHNIIIRIPLLYGPSPSTSLGPVGWILEALKKGSPLNLFTDEWRNPIYISDTVNILFGLIDSKFKGLMHLPGPDRLSRYEMGMLISKVFKLNSDLISACLRSDVPSIPPRPKDVSLGSHKLKLVTELIPRSFEAGVLDWHEKTLSV